MDDGEQRRTEDWVATMSSPESFFDCDRRLLKIVLADPEDLFCVDIKIMMGDNIAETLDTRPIDFWILRKKNAGGNFV